MGCDARRGNQNGPEQISIHASRMGCDLGVQTLQLLDVDFNPRIPYGMRPGAICLGDHAGYFNPRIPYGMRHCSWCIDRLHCHFNPRIPYGMRRSVSFCSSSHLSFQSTHPVWDATLPANMPCQLQPISIHASRMGCDLFYPDMRLYQCISIHASRMGCDQPERQSDPSRLISIHASRMGCDSTTCLPEPHPQDFNPRIPYGMRRRKRCSASQETDFNPRIPYGMRLCRLTRHAHATAISIHASRMGCDVTDSLEPSPVQFQSTHPVWDATSAVMVSSLKDRYFNPRIPYGMRLREWTLHSIIWKFLPALRADYIADIPEHLSVCIFGL